jgi:peptide deformylase
MDAAREPLSLLPREDARLARRAAEVVDFRDPAFQRFIDELIRCGQENLGVGIAAPQVGLSLRIFIMAPKPGPRYPDAPLVEPFAVINPVVHRVYGESLKDWEGCLSVPGYRGLVPRHEHVDVSYLDRFGQAQSATFSGFLARLFQHEFDHLEGILYPTRMDKEDPLLTLEEYAARTGSRPPA